MNYIAQKNCLLLLVTTIFFLSCKKEDGEPIVHQPINSKLSFTNSIRTDNSDTHTFFSLKSSESENKSLQDWDLVIAFGENTIFLNGSKSIKIAKSRKGIEEIKNIEQLTFKEDHPSRNPSLSAFGDLLQDISYIIDKGLDARGNSLGYLKLEFTYLSEERISFMIGDIEQEDNFESNTITNDHTTDNAYYNFEQGVIEYEPEDWDFEYLSLNNDKNLRSILTSNKLSVAIINKNENEIQGSDIANAIFSSAKDVIADNWYVVQNKQFKIVENITFLIIQTGSSKLYKFHFSNISENGNGFTYKVVEL